MAYWIYQHLGNLSPPELEEDTIFPQVKDEEDAGPLLRRLAHTWDRESAASRWAFYRDFGDTRLLVLDSRAARVLSDGRRADDRRRRVGLDRRALRAARSTT